MIETIDQVAADIKSRLQDGAKRRKSALHTPVVGTADGHLRVMVLREFDPETHTLRFHTDARSPKCAAISQDPAVSVLAYDAEAKVQIRMRGVGRVESHGPVAEAAWLASTTFARRCYLAESAPSSLAGQPVSGLPDWAEGITPTEDDVAPARDNFAVLLVKVEKFDWLYLANTGHRRAQITPQGGGYSGEWLVP